jgi:polysaccharide chain length determinant protein (PEP-CTERM system associated)
MNSLYEQFLVALHAVWHRRWLALAVAWGLALVGWLVVALIPNSYESSARVYVSMQSILPTQVGISPVDQQKAIDRVRDTLTSATNLEKVIRRTDLGLRATSDAEVAEMVDKLRTQITIKALQDNLFTITSVSRVSGLSDAQNAKLARSVVQNLIDLFVEGNLAGGRIEMTQTLRFLDDQLRQREKDLEAAEARRVAFEQKFLGLMPGQGSIGSRIDAARNEMDNIDQQLVAANSSLSAVNSQLAGIQPTVAAPSITINNGGASSSDGSTAGRIAALQGQIADGMARGWTEKYPDIVAARAQIARLQAQAAREPHSAAVTGATQPNPMYVTLKTMAAERGATVAALSARRTQLANDLAQLTAKQTEEPGVAAQEAQLNRDYAVLKEQYDKLLGDREEVRLRSAVQNKTDSVKFQVIDPPNLPRVPVAPNRPLLLTVILLFAVAAGIAVAFAKGQLQMTYPTARALETATGLQVVGTVSDVLTPVARLRQQLQFKWFAGLGAGLGGFYALLMAIEFIQRSGIA